MKRTIVAVLAAALLLTSLPAVAAATSGTATVSVQINERLVVTPTDGGVTVQANVPWQLVVDTADGTHTVSGKATSGTYIEMPDTAAAYWVVAD